MVFDIYYFSGTGNSLHIARELKKRIPHLSLIPIAGLLNERLNKNNHNLKTTAEVIGFIFPCHGLTIPVPLLKFLKNIDLSSAKYIFAIVTRGGSVFHGFSKIEKILGKQRKKLDASFIINMWMNDPKLKFFKEPTKEELRNIEVNVQDKLNLIQDIITYQEQYHDDINGDTFSNFKSLNYILERLVAFTVHHIAPKVKDYFYTDTNCIGCGVCEKACLSKKIKLVNDKPVWQKDIDCYYCYTCLNFCPNQAIQIYSKFYMKSYTKEKGRYTHPYVRVKDIINQKSIPFSLLDNYSRDFSHGINEKHVIAKQK
ncbi:MAG: EFR1 family ferrodoxin [Candidatus Hermodarchaeota archaeon]